MGPPPGAVNRLRQARRSRFRTPFRPTLLTAPAPALRHTSRIGESAARLGNSLTVEQRTLTPSVLVRIQVPQPTSRPLENCQTLGKPAAANAGAGLNQPARRRRSGLINARGPSGFPARIFRTGRFSRCDALADAEGAGSPSPGAAFGGDVGPAEPHEGEPIVHAPHRDGGRMVRSASLDRIEPSEPTGDGEHFRSPEPRSLH